jgi:predicted cupin superfamily sugar epimerase
MDIHARELIHALRMAPVTGGGWAGPATDGARPGSAAERPVLTVWTRLLAGGTRLAWRRSRSDVLLFFHSGSCLEIAGEAGQAPLVLGADPARGNPQQLTVPGGSWHSVRAMDGYALWSEAVVPGAAEWEYGDDRPPTPSRADGRPVRSRRPPAPLAESLDLTPHVEGGYYRQIYESSGEVTTPSGPRKLANTIYYLLDRDSPVGHLHRNVSGITHFLHSGGPIRYHLLSPDGSLSESTLGFDRAAGQVPAFTCPGGWWKASSLPDGVQHGLISELVGPGFDFADQCMATPGDLGVADPRDARRLMAFISASAQKGQTK